ncbi:hypothetical protein C0989_009058 [Termitomyces sp. Mn162]|nr:hypothetical protein C0989_009058 [Termitomyces sp. Mn162]
MVPVYNIFEFNNSTATQAYDDANQQLVVASHNDTIKLFSIGAGGKYWQLCHPVLVAPLAVDITELWVIPPAADAIPTSLKFFGAGSQNILLNKIDYGEM